MTCTPAGTGCPCDNTRPRTVALVTWAVVNVGVNVEPTASTDKPKACTIPHRTVFMVGPFPLSAIFCNESARQEFRHVVGAQRYRFGPCSAQGLTRFLASREQYEASNK